MIKSVYYSIVWNFCWFFLGGFQLQVHIVPTIPGMLWNFDVCMLNKVLSSLIQRVFERYCNANFLRMPKFNIVVFKGRMFFKGHLLVIVCHTKKEKIWYFLSPSARTPNFSYQNNVNQTYFRLLPKLARNTIFERN